MRQGNQLRTLAGLVAAGALLAMAPAMPATAATPPAVDVLFIFDTTGSMGGALAEAKTQVRASADSIRTSYPDSYFAVAEVADYPPDVPWVMWGNLDPSLDQLQSSIDRLYASGGGDGPEAYTRALWEAAQPEIGWRAGSKHLVVLVNDNVPHDTDLNEGVPIESQRFPSPFNTGVDPGVDGVAGTGDDLDWQATLQLLKTSGIVFASVLYSGAADYLPYWEWWTKLTGGVTNVGGSGTPLGDTLTALVVAGVTSSPPPSPKLTVKTSVKASTTWIDPTTAPTVQLTIRVFNSDGTPAVGAKVRKSNSKATFTIPKSGKLNLIESIEMNTAPDRIDIIAQDEAGGFGTAKVNLYSLDIVQQCRADGRPSDLGKVAQYMDFVMPASPGKIGSIMGDMFNWLGAAGLASSIAPDSEETVTLAYKIRAGSAPTIYAVRVAYLKSATDEVIQSSTLYSTSYELIKPMMERRGTPLEQIGQYLSCGLPA